MNDFSVNIETNPSFFLDIETSEMLGDIASSSSTATIESSDQSNIVLEIEAASVTDMGTLIIEKFDSYNLEIITHEAINSYTIPDNIPISKIVGNLPVSRIDGLDDYLNAYTFDGGTP